MDGIDQKLMMCIVKDATLIHGLRVLALEYHAKTITPERFAERVYDMVYEHSLDAPQDASPKPKHSLAGIQS